MQAQRTAQRAIVLAILDRERPLAELERIVGAGAVEAVKVLAADGAVVRHGGQVWASPCLLRLDDLGLVAV
jgi:hypothetical protein